ncbi:unnamed protein product, partial [Cladocopium goreaui]
DQVKAQDQLKAKRRNAAIDFIFCGAYLEEPLELSHQLGRSVFGEVYLARRFGQPVAVKLPRFGGPMDPEPILALEFKRACSLSHPNLVRPLERIGAATVWQLVSGAPWKIAVSTLGLSGRTEVAKQVLDVTQYCIAKHHEELVSRVA